MESSTPKRRRRAEGSPHCTPGRVTVTVQRALSTYVGKGYPGQNKLFILEFSGGANFAGEEYTGSAACA